MADRIGQQLGKYRLVRLLGRGGFAEVYLGVHVDLGTQAAVKVLHAQLTSKDLERFRAEAATIARLNHPHIVRLMEFATEEGTPFLVLDYAPGGTLRDRHSRGAPLPLKVVLPYVWQACDALQYAHDHRLIHRDVKPENLLLAADGRVLLSDFGIATVARSSYSQSTQEALGTVTYMAPEQIQGKPRPASDLYALGIIVYEWLTGDPPFNGSFGEVATQHLFAPPPPLREQVPTLPEAVEAVVLTALAKDPHQRFPDAEAFATALEEAAQGKMPLLYLPTQSTPPTSPNTPTLPARFNWPAETTRRASAPPVTLRTAPELPPTFVTPPARAATTLRPPRPHEVKKPSNVFRNALVAVLALLLIGTTGVALALSSRSGVSNSGASQGGTTGAPTSSGGSSFTAIVNSTVTPTPTPGVTPGATSNPFPTATSTPWPTPTDTSTPTPTPTVPSVPAVLTITPTALHTTDCTLAQTGDWICLLTLSVNADATSSLRWNTNGGPNVSYSPTSGTLSPGQSITVTVSISSSLCPALVQLYIGVNFVSPPAFYC